MNFASRLLGLVLVALSAGFALGADDPPAFAITRPDAKEAHPHVRADVAAERVTFVVDRKADIDKAVVRRTSGVWPKFVVVRFENFPALEGFHVSNGESRAEARLGFGERKSPGPVPIYDARTARDEKPTGTADVVVARVAEHIEVTLPASLLPQDDAVLRLEWVDAYR